MESPTTLRRASSSSSSPLTAASATAVSSSLTKQEPPQVDAWIVQKLKNDWSSSEFGSLLSKDKLSDAVTSFRHLDTAIKVRFLLSFLSMRRDVVDESKFAIVEIIDAAENDAEEWVKVGAGIVKQYMFMSDDGAESGDTFFHDELASTAARVIAAVQSPPSSFESTDVFSHTSTFMNASVRPSPLQLQQTQQHFTVVAPLRPAASTTTTTTTTTKTTAPTRLSLHTSGPSTGAASLPTPLAAAASTRVTPSANAKLPAAPPPPPRKKLQPELSEIRRKADAGRFKRHRSRISMIDLDEVKQIEVDKALKAEEHKRQRLAAAAKDKMQAAAAVAAAAAAAAAAVAVANERSDKSSGMLLAAAASAGDVVEEEEEDGEEEEDDDDDDESDDAQHEEGDDDEEDDDDALLRGLETTTTTTTARVGSGSNDDDALDGNSNANRMSEFGLNDGTQALLTAAIMTEVGHPQPTHQLPLYSTQQQQQQQQQQQLYPLPQQQQTLYPFEQQPSQQSYPYPQQQQQQHLYQQHQQTQQTYHHRGFEPEDVSPHHQQQHQHHQQPPPPFNYGFGSAWGTTDSFVSPQQQQQTQQQAFVPAVPLYQSLPQLHQFSGLNTDFLTDQSVLLPPPPPSRHATSNNNNNNNDNNNNNNSMGFDPTGSNTNTNTNNGSGYLDGPPDYWR